MSRHYLDHASTSPTRPGALEGMLPWFAATADPGRVHSEGHAARVAVEVAREQVSGLLGARSREVVFTSGATESVVTATWMATERGDHVIVPAVEHRCVRDASAAHRVTVVGVDRAGRVDPDAVLAAVEPGTALVHLQVGNHEVGTLQPVAEVVAACRERGVLVHLDAAQAAARTGRIVAAAEAGELGDDVVLLGDPDPAGRLPHLVCLAVGGVEAEPVLLGLDQAGVAVHSGSSCSSESLEPSPVLEAMGVDAERSLRISVGWSTTDADVDAFLGAMPTVVARLRSLRT